MLSLSESALYSHAPGEPAGRNRMSLSGCIFFDLIRLKYLWLGAQYIYSIASTISGSSLEGSVPLGDLGTPCTLP